MPDALEQAARDELTACINILYEKLRAAVGEHPHYMSGLRDAALELRKRAQERGIPTPVDDDITKPMNVPRDP